MKARNSFTLIGSSALLLIVASCGGGGLGGYGSSSGSGGGGTIATITISPATSSIAPNATQQYTAVAKDSGNNTITGATYVWKSSDSSVATVNSNGLATAIAAGTTTITASISYGSMGGGCTGPYCSGSGSAYTITSNQATLTVSASGMVMGTAAVGHPFVDALVSMRDAQGQTQFATTDMHGRFEMPVSGMTAPFLLKVSDNQGHVMYSLGNAAGVINIDPFTDVMARTLFQSHGMSIASVLANPDDQLQMDNASLGKLDQALVSALAGSLSAQGVNSARLSLLNTPFTANGSGLDAVLDHTHFTQQNGRFLITNDDTGAIISLETSRNSIMMHVLNPDKQQPDSFQTLKF